MTSPTVAVSTLGVGKEIVTTCGRCQLKLAHLIVTMKNTKTPGRVQCKTCDSTHLYKDSTMTSAATKVKATRKVTKKDTRSNEEIWTSAIKSAKNNDEIKPYSITANFFVGDIIEHINFGKGIVQSLVSKEKIEVVFQDNIKTLVHNK